MYQVSHKTSQLQDEEELGRLQLYNSRTTTIAINHVTSACTSLVSRRIAVLLPLGVQYRPQCAARMWPSTGSCLAGITLCTIPIRKCRRTWHFLRAVPLEPWSSLLINRWTPSNVDSFDSLMELTALTNSPLFADRRLTRWKIWLQLPRPYQQSTSNYYNPHVKEYSDRISEWWNKHKSLLTELHGNRVSQSDMLRIFKDEHDSTPSWHQLRNLADSDWKYDKPIIKYW